MNVIGHVFPFVTSVLQLHLLLHHRHRHLLPPPLLDLLLLIH